MKRVIRSMKDIKDLGEVKGKVLVFGGVYSNLQALEKMKNIADNSNISPSNIFCTGDIVGYCAQPEESLRLIKNWGINSIAGNVEIQLRNDEDACGCNFGDGTRCDVLSRNWYPFAQESISDEMKEWLHCLPEFIQFNYAGKKVFLLHGGLHNTSQFIFQSTEWDIKQSILEETKADVVLAGHCGLPFSDVNNNQFWLNAGVIGMPANDGTPRVWYMILNDDNGHNENGFEFQHHSFEYENEKATHLMKENQLPQSYAETLLTGIWDNCDILPKVETRLQGLEIIGNNISH